MITPKLSRDGIHLSFQYNRELVKSIQSVPGRWWDPIKKEWIIPFYSVENLLAMPEFGGISGQVKEWIEKRNQRIDDLIKNVQSLGRNLYNYQLNGIKFILERRNVFLYMSVGMGKTSTALGAAKALLDVGAINRVFIFSPISVKSHWNEESADLFKLHPIIIGGDASERALQWREAQQHNIVILHYELCVLEREQANLKALIGDGQHTMIILDECTRIKNYRTKTATFLRSLNVMYKVLLSGRLIENKPDELFAMNRFLKNSHLGSWEQFVTDYMVLDGFNHFMGYRNIDMLGRKLKPIIYHIDRENYQEMLPNKTEVYHRVQLSTPEKSDYSQVSGEIDEMLEQLKVMGDAPQEEVQLIENSIFSRLTLLKMLCDHPDLIRNSNSEMAKKMNLKSTTSSKLHELTQILETLESENVIIFTQFSKMAQIIHNVITTSRRKAFLVTGDTHQNLRGEIIKQFKDSPGSVLVCTDVFGYGVNLQHAAHYIINYDLPWNPAKLEQRIGRIYRLGQKHNVHIINIIVQDEDKIEKHILNILANKKKLYEEVFSAQS